MKKKSVTNENIATKFQLALSIFGEYMCSPGPVLDHKICRIVFLNKVDLFQEKLRSDENEHQKWKEFKQILGYKGERDVNSALKFIEQSLYEINDRTKSKLIIHVTNALDTALMTRVAADIKSAILSDSMKTLGLLNDDYD